MAVHTWTSLKTWATSQPFNVSCLPSKGQPAFFYHDSPNGPGASTRDTTGRKITSDVQRALPTEPSSR